MNKPKPKKILLIEQHDGFRESLTELLSLHYKPVYASKEGIKALQFAIKHPPDLFICARSFFDHSCWDILQEVRKNELLKYTPFIFLSSKPAGEIHQAMTNEKGVFVLTKPFPAEELLLLIEQCSSPTPQGHGFAGFYA